MRLILIMILATIGISAAAQSYTGDYLNARKRLTVRGSNIDTIKNDTTGLSGRTKTLMTADAIYKFVNGRVGIGGSGMTNPMTTEGDLIIGGVSGTPTRLGIGTNNYVLTSNGTTASWQAAANPVVSDSAWGLTGNNITYGKYIGTKNDFDLRIFTNSIQRLNVDSLTGELQIGGFTTGSNGDGKLLLKGRTNDGVFYGNIYFKNKDGNTVEWLTSISGTSFFYNNGIDERLTIGRTTEMVVNQNGADYDFRIEGDTDPNLFWTDASKDEVYIGTTSDAGLFKLQVGGGAAFSGASTFYSSLNVFGTLATSAVSQAGGPMTWDIYSSLDRNLTFTDGGSLGAKDLIRFFSGETFVNITSGDGNILFVNPIINQSSGAGNIIGYRFKPVTTSVISKIYSIYADTGMVYIDDKVGIGTPNPDEELHIVGSIKIVDGTQGTGKVLTSDANGVASWQTPTGNTDEGSYTPTITNGTNVAASTAYTTNWFRVGDRIHVFGEIQIDATSAGNSAELSFTLPVASTLSNSYSLAGTAVHEDGTPVRIFADTVNGRAQLKFTPNTATANTYSFHFSYLYVAP